MYVVALVDLTKPASETKEGNAETNVDRFPRLSNSVSVEPIGIGGGGVVFDMFFLFMLKF